MLNSSVYNKFSYNINAVSGTLRKSHPKSKFCVRHINEEQAVFSEMRPQLNWNNDKKEIVILQIMLTGENKCLIEYVYKQDFESEADNE